uniref:Uncharacterized protein n=1 Tax=Timema poppense TaxID=170557 RepID=A0A7R9GY52_TIMPO|nr:unnamed protein product [Timema poppensis]
MTQGRRSFFYVFLTITAPCRIWGRGPPYCDCDGCDRMSKRGLRMRAGWRHDWNSADNEFARVIIPGPFCEPALVTSSPFVFLSTDHRERRRDDCSRYFPAHQRRCAILRSGIPDPWAEYLTLRGVPQVCRRANPEEVHLWRDHLDHVESLWGRLGLSLAQGIPDPWKNWPKCCSSQKLRPDACQRLKTRIPRTCRNRSNSCDSFLTQREAALQFYNCGDPKDMRAKSDSVLICRPRNNNEWHGPTFNIEELQQLYNVKALGPVECKSKTYFAEWGQEGERHDVASQPTKVSFRANKNRCITETVDGASYWTGLAEKSYLVLATLVFVYSWGPKDENCYTHPRTAMVYKFRPSKPLTTMSLVARALGEMILSPTLVPLLPLPWWRRGEGKGAGGCILEDGSRANIQPGPPLGTLVDPSLFTSRLTRSQISLKEELLLQHQELTAGPNGLVMCLTASTPRESCMMFQVLYECCPSPLDLLI